VNEREARSRGKDVKNSRSRRGRRARVRFTAAGERLVNRPNTPLFDSAGIDPR
jgi:hypothetical protein